MTYLRNTIVFALATLAGACTNTPLREYVPQIVTPYRIDIQQGNFVTLDMVDKLQAGQTKEQVRFILGTPLLTDVFHQERWDFIFRSAKGWNNPEKRRLTVFFDKAEKVEKWEAVDVPKAIDVATPAVEEPPGFFRRILGGSSNTAAPSDAPVIAAAEPATAPIAGAATAGTTLVEPPPTPAISVPPTPAAPAGDASPGFFARLFGRSKPNATAPVESTATPASATTAAAAKAPAVSAAAPKPAPEPITALVAAPAPAEVPALPNPVPTPVNAAAPTAVAIAAAPAAQPITPTVPPPTPEPAPTPASAPALAQAPSAAAAAMLPDTPAPVRAAIVAAVEQWRQAWSSKNLAAYLASYEPKFTLTGLSRAEWQAQRADRIRRAASIRVAVSELRMAMEGDGAVAVSFVQKYESPAFTESGRKLLVFSEYNGKWLIREESFLANSK